jgi:hypothetical protein
MTTSLKRLMEEDAGRPVPPTPVDRVLAGGQARVRRRWTVGSVAAALIAVLAIAIPVGFLGEESTDQPIEPPGSGSLTFTRKDGSTFTVGDADVRCDDQTLYVIGGDRRPGPDGKPRGAVFMVQVDVADVPERTTVNLPAERPFLFVYDAEHDNELSTSTEESTGTLIVDEASCGSTPSVDVSIDAKVGSEFFQTPGVRVDGRLTLGD